MNNLLKRIFRTVLCAAISFFVWFFLSKTFASTDTMSTTFQNISKESWLMITDYLYDNIEDVTIKSKIQPITTNGEYSTQMYTALKTYLNNITITANDNTMITRYKYAHSDLSRLTFIVYNNNIYIYSNQIWQRKSGTTDYTLDSYEFVDTASYTFSSNVFKFYDDSSSNTLYVNNRGYIYINLNNYTITNGTGSYSSLGANLTMSRYTVTQNDDLTLWSYGSNSDTTMIVQFAGSGTNGNPVISYFLKDYLVTSGTLYPMLLKNAVYLDGSPNTGGSTGGNTGTDTGGGGGSDSGGGTTDVDLGQIEEELGNINSGINSPDSTINNNLDDIENEINDLNNNITTVPDLSEKEEITSDDIINNFGFEFTVDPYDNFWNTLTSDLQSILTTNDNRTITLEFRGETYTISVDDFNFNSMPSILKNFLQLLTISIFTYFLVCWVKKSVDLISSGDMSEVLEMNEEEGIVDLF